MKRALSLLALTTVVASATITTTSLPAGAADGVSPVVPLFHTIDLPSYPEDKGHNNIYVVHGLNLDGQDAQDDGGTEVSVCVEGESLDAALEFGDIIGPISLEVGAEVDIQVIAGAGTPCDSTDTPIVDESFTVPDNDYSYSLVVTAGPGGDAPELLPIPLNTDDPGTCLVPTDRTPAGPAPLTGRLGLAHAAALPLASVLIDDLEPTEIVYSQSTTSFLIPDMYTLAVEVEGAPVIGPLDVALDPCTLVEVYMVGGQPLPEPTTTTTAPATTTTAAAAAAAVVPRFTG